LKRKVKNKIKNKEEEVQSCRSLSLSLSLLLFLHEWLFPSSAACLPASIPVIILLFVFLSTPHISSHRIA
jgi:hypothetical protein